MMVQRSSSQDVVVDSINGAERLLTPREVAAEFGEFFTEPRLRQWRWRGGGPRYTKLGRRCLYWRRDIQTWLDAHAQTATREARRDDRDSTDNAAGVEDRHE